jgi:hypothetical protein
MLRATSMSILLRFSGNNCYMNAPKYNVVSTVSVLFEVMLMESVLFEVRIDFVYTIFDEHRHEKS